MNADSRVIHIGGITPAKQIIDCAMSHIYAGLSVLSFNNLVC